jgi:hypothetical protein
LISDIQIAWRSASVPLPAPIAHLKGIAGKRLTYRTPYN